MDTFKKVNACDLMATLEANHIDTKDLTNTYFKGHLSNMYELEEFVEKLTFIEKELKIVRQESLLNRISLISQNKMVAKQIDCINDRQSNIEETVRNDRESINGRVSQLEQLSEKNYRTLHNKLTDLARESLSLETVPIIRPNKGEEKLLTDILGAKFHELKNTADCVNRKNIDFLANQAITTAIETCNLLRAGKTKIDSITDISYEDLKRLKFGFLSILQNSNPMTGMLGQFIRTGNDIYDIGKFIYNATEKAQDKIVKDKHYKVQATNLMTSLIQMTVDGTKICFDKATHVYLARYYATYDFDDVCYNNYRRTYSSIKNYEEKFIFQGLLSAKIDLHRQILVDLKIDDNIPCSYYYYTDYLQYIKKKNYLFYVKEKKVFEFAIKHKLYRAYLKLGEFDVIDKCGDRMELGITLACTAVAPIFGLGAVLGAGFAISRLKNEQRWSQNILRLKEVMKSHLKIDTKFDFIIDKLYTLEKLRYYIDLTKSQYGNELLLKNLEELGNEFKNEESKITFERAFNLYQKMTHTGIADRENYIHLNIDYAEKSLKDVYDQPNNFA